MEQAIERQAVAEKVLKHKNVFTNFFMNDRMLEIQKWILYGVGFLLPVWFLPWGGVDISREMLFGTLLFVSFGLWLSMSIFSNKITYIKSPLNLAVGLLLLTHIVSVVFSKALHFLPSSSDVLGEKLGSFVLYALAYALVVGVLKHKNDAMIFSLWMIAGGGVMALVTFLQFFGTYILPFELAHRPEFNVIGTVNALALFYAFAFLLTVGFVLSVQKRMEAVPLSLRIGLFTAMALFLLNLAVINFINAWAGLLLGLFIFVFLYARQNKLNLETFKNKYFYGLASLIFITLLFVFIRVPLFSSINMSVEILPSQQGTISIAMNAWKNSFKDMLFGTGPGTFQYSYILYHDNLINLTNFWGVRFVQGFSYATTIFATLGIAGILSFALLIVGFLWTAARGLFKNMENPMSQGIFVGGLFLVTAWFFYPANFTLNLSLFFMLGFLAVISRHEGENVRWHGERSFDWSSPWANFALSLMGIFVIGASIAGTYSYVQRYRAALLVEAAVKNAQVGGQVDVTLEKLTNTAKIDYMNDAYFRFLSQARLLKIQNIINESKVPNPSASLSVEFQKNIEGAIAAFERAIELNPIEPFNYRTAGAIYEALIPFVPGADRPSFEKYKKAAELDALNPLVYAELARAYLAAADLRASLLQQKGSSQDQIKLWNEERTEALRLAHDALTRSVEVKSDFATAHYMLAQTALREGKLSQAIKNLEDARKSAPNDVGVLFQLGVLYYQNQQYGNAEGAFADAITVNPDYSNARYFLGIILDNRGERDSALKHFERIAELNPDNREVAQIVLNLRAGRAAIENAVQATQNSKDVPVAEQGGEKQTPIRRR